MNINIALQSQAHTNTKNSTPSNEGSNPSGSDPYNKELTNQRSKNVVKNAFSSGSTYSHALDGERIKGRRAQIFALMGDRKFRSLTEIANTVGGSEAAASARLRDFRKAKYGSYTVIGKRFGDKKSGFWKYQVLPPLSTLTEQHGGNVRLSHKDRGIVQIPTKKSGSNPDSVPSLREVAKLVHARDTREAKTIGHSFLNAGASPALPTSLAEINGQFIMGFVNL